MKKYECLYVIDGTFDNDVISEVTTKFENLAKDNAKESEVNNWGRRKLAYEVNKKWDGYYSLITFRSEPDFVAELERQLRLDEKVIKFLVTVVDEKKIEKLANAPKKPPRKPREFNRDHRGPRREAPAAPATPSAPKVEEKVASEVNTAEAAE
ncbi:hypothetical protein AZF37_08605 [endosymbiont 'TC1' of Trimyema compressum]|uniref:30S ribosomal protein S6 n=1 Tax=endosymbiont 'TC1' of Trimyema compressum TaxID=243899 RepID=UPI0007F15F00|nr:30S ribosomal protein S6 [endosymbiont 'TC1' of Trimyema compressum]AMP21207.1 hypothetical protein AZF37_08605 [endosymbiont 'TC1' of Trimyema compressum]